MAAEIFPKRLTITDRQIDRLRAVWPEIISANPFYTRKLAEVSAPRKIRDLRQFASDVPFTTKKELAEDQRSAPPYGTNLTYPLTRYTRCHQTSGTSGLPLRWLDTPESWQAMMANWEQVLRIGGLRPGNRVFFAFSFGPFLGFWLAFEAGLRMGCLCLPGGGMSSTARLRQILDHGTEFLCATPTYAIHLAETAEREKIDLSASPIRRIVVAGEPGGSIPATRARIEQLWPGATVFDHHGMTEVGPVSFECAERPGVLHIMEHAFIAEIIDPATGQHVESGTMGELVLTTLSRTGSPVVRYRTGDLVRSSHETVCKCGRSELALEGGILGRSDDMVVVRGVNVYPSAVEEIIQQCGGIAEYRVRVTNEKALMELQIEVEPEPTSNHAALAEQLERKFQDLLSLRVSTKVVSSLPRFEMKAARWIRE